MQKLTFISVFGGVLLKSIRILAFLLQRTHD